MNYSSTKKSTKLAILATLILIPLIVAGICGSVWWLRKPLVVRDWAGGKVDRSGTYTLVGGEELRVWINDNGIVCFKLSEKNGRVLMENDINASTYQRWAIFVDDRKWVWLDSSDIGGYVWKTDEQGPHHYKGVHGDAALEKAAPVGFRVR